MKKKEKFSRDNTYDKFKKEKSPFLKSFRRSFEILFLWLFDSFTSLFSFSYNQKIGSLLGSLAYSLSKKDREIAMFQLKFAIPELNDSERKKIVKECFQNFGKSLFEVLSINSVYKNRKKYIEVHHKEVLEKALSKGKGVVLITGHYGNWELLPVIFAENNWFAKAIVRKQGEQKIHKFLNNKRENEFFKIISRGDKSAAKSIINCLKEKHSLIMAIDQDTQVPSVFTSFFGRPAKTPKSAASFAIKFSSPVVGIYNYRDEKGRLHFDFEIMSEGPYEKGEETVQKLTEQYNSVLEKFILRNPGQWAWFHRRWKTQPKKESNEREVSL